MSTPLYLERAQEEKPSAEAYADYGVNPYVNTAEDQLSTFGIDVDTASYAIVRRKLGENALPPKEAVRVEEFVNAFNYGYEAPADKAFAVNFAAAPSPALRGNHLLRIGLASKKNQSQNRPPAHLVFLVDTSGSMQSPDKLGMVQTTLRTLTQNLKPGDTVALCTYAGSTQELLQPTGMESRAKILAAIDSLTAGGGTAMSSGIDTAYALAKRTLKPGEINRVIVLSDGDANIGPSGHEAILSQIAQYKAQGITLSTVGVGNGNYKDTMMEQLADKGDGNYSYIDSADEARKVFGRQLDANLQVVARDVKLQVSFDPALVKRYRLVGYENRDVADKDFRNDKVDGGEVGAGHTVTALYDLELSEQAKGKSPSSLATVKVRFMPEGGSQAEELSFDMPASSLFATFEAAPRNYQLAVAIAGFAESLRQSPYASGLDQTLALAKAAVSDNEDESEFIRLIEKAIELGGPRTKIVAAQ
jgi:Ca-activated chloride channel family protein